MPYRVTLIPGDGVGPEVTDATKRVVEATGVEFNWDIGIVGEKAQIQSGTPLPEEVLLSIKKNAIALKGPVTTPIGKGFRSVNVALRKSLDLFVSLRPCKTYPGVLSVFDNVNLVIVRENTEDVYAGIEYARGTKEAEKLIEFMQSTGNSDIKKDSGFSIKMISESGSKRIVKFAFEYARKNHRKKVTAGHKANIMKFSDGLFLSVAREVAKEYPDIEFEELVIDALCMRLVRNPGDFDVFVLPNLYGDIVSDLCAGLIGGLGLAPGANIGESAAIFEPAHGSAPDIAGQNKANPMAMMLSAVMMLEHLGEKSAARRMEEAITQVIADGQYVTGDLNPKDTRNRAGTSQVADAIIKKMKEDSNARKTN
jgi:isocitrate dehydrogenase (NAD+)